ncbi:Inositol 2-dehydrogenase/D-chiro-inositol 3-dehydrogenase [Pedobacter sp. Bi27]|uniref:Gfo/Idh/MocA family protein n=1 Tax=unclassified Pedobacter TaxID=2628915 RepID=UPI001DD59064|nr:MULTISPECIES: Gfo/Idh/MocA family oxidoreductase [unclassified Pedobacter]CAH0244890.1 Inositol 2-dehydrogenase/D-chiro-inositol 3-dehydrogenase [Pedobacter sp. Bi27]CAH0281956.1 Inositol 2-dehydrogenase/D-chiro-inositol 3-dehydrogenase [Pedobacter sp. Bi126]CAH0308327.1 Inositol 2-dehydrogenase/D-chiro-inositol 3-dehydrogenase [Pedobacter sp. Bi36]
MKTEQENKNTSNRRDFIKTTAIAAAAFMIVPRHVLGGPGYLAPSDRLLVAGIGVGGKGQSDLSMFYKSGKADIAFLCDVDDRRAANSVKAFPKAKYYKDWREMLDKEHKNFDAVSVSTPDHNHAIQALAAMQLGKHVYVQKPLTHDIYEARILTAAAKKYKVVTQMGNQGASNDGPRQMKEWYEAGLIGDVHTVYAWTDRPVWPQGIPRPTKKAEIPAELDWNLWLGTAPEKDYIDKLVPFNWRGWWDYGTGALGDMGCHLIEAPFSVLNLKYAKEVQASVGSVYVDEFKRGYFPESCPPSSHVTLKFPKTDKTKGDVTLHWMDGGIQPERPEELEANETFGDGGNGTLFIGTKGKMMSETYSANPKLLPLSKNKDIKVAPKYTRVPDGANGHYKQWVEAAIAGYGKQEVSSPFEIAGPLTEALLMANLAIRSFDIQKTVNGKTTYPGRYTKMLWDNDNMKVTNFDEANQFVKREYRKGWNNLTL